MEGTVRMCKELGYSDEQAELIGKIDDLFEEAIKLNLVTDREAIDFGIYAGTVMGRHTGKL